MRRPRRPRRRFRQHRQRRHRRRARALGRGAHPGRGVQRAHRSAAARVRKIYRKSGRLASTKIVDDEKKNRQFRDYLDFREAVHHIPPHRILAINRGERAGILRIKIETDDAAIEQLAIELLVPPEHPHKDFLTGCVKDTLARLVFPSLEHETRRDLTEKAELHAVEVFAKNLRNLLLQPPLAGRRILAIDPGYKNGCKLAAIDEFGSLLVHDLIHIVGSDEQKAAARAKLIELIKTHSLSVIAVGNGTACRQPNNFSPTS